MEDAVCLHLMISHWLKLADVIIASIHKSNLVGDKPNAKDVCKEIKL